VTAERDRTAVVMSIRAPYADALMDGTKRWEFRRQPLPEGVQWILSYRSGAKDGRGVVGLLRVIGQDTASCRAWGQGPCSRGYGHGRVDPLFGISIDSLAYYAADPVLGLGARVTGIAVHVEERFPGAVPLAAYGLSRPAQSWCYAPVGWRGTRTLEAAP